jgi:hypothetical protein
MPTYKGCENGGGGGVTWVTKGIVKLEDEKSIPTPNNWVDYEIKYEDHKPMELMYVEVKQSNDESGAHTVQIAISFDDGTTWHVATGVAMVSTAKKYLVILPYNLLGSNPMIALQDSEYAILYLTEGGGVNDNKRLLLQNLKVRIKLTSVGTNQTVTITSVYGAMEALT